MRDLGFNFEGNQLIDAFWLKYAANQFNVG